MLLAYSLACTLPDGTVACNVPDLIAAINRANSNPSPRAINLDSGCIYTLIAVDNSAVIIFRDAKLDYSENSRPQIITPITINGIDASIVHANNFPDFRFFL